MGSNLVDALVERAGSVCVLDDLSIGRSSNLDSAAADGDVELIEGDICDEEVLRRAMTGADVVFHLAVSCLRVSLFDPWESHRVNAGGTLAALEAARDAGVERFVYSSSSEVYGTAQDDRMNEEHPVAPTTVYGASKLAGETYAQAFFKTYGLPVIVVRPFNSYGYREHHEGPHGEVIPKMVVRALNGVPPVIFGDGEQTRDFTFVTETARGMILAAECDALVGDAVNVASGRDVSIGRIAELVCELCAPELEPSFAPARPADVRHHRADVRKAERLLGFRTGIALEDGLERYVQWLRESHDPRTLLAEEVERNWEAPAAR